MQPCSPPLRPVRPTLAPPLCFCTTEEIDSYLYQTVGQDGLHFIAQAMELPLFRRTIMGTAVDQAADYAASSSAARLKGAVEGDETEDLYLLLQDVLVRRIHPSITFSCCR